MKTKVLYIMSLLAREGPTKQLYYLLKYLDRDRFEPSILTLSPETDNTLRPLFEELGVPIQSLNLPPNFGGLVTGPARFRATFAVLAPDIVHSFGFRADLLTGHFLKCNRKLFSVRGDHFREYPLNHGRLIGTLMALMHLTALKKADVLVACSKSIERAMKRFGRKMMVIPNGVDRVPGAATPIEREALRRKLGLPLDRTIFISSGFLSERKDPITLIQGFLASKAAKNGVLLLVGDGPLMEQCRSIAKDHPNLVVVGFVKNIWDYLNASDYFVSASLAEGMPNAILEALSAGIPVCLSDISPHREIWEYDETMGVLFPTRDVSSVAEKIDELCGRSHADMQRAALLVSTEHFSAKRMSEDYQRAYARIASS